MDYVWFGLGLCVLTGLTVVLGRLAGIGLGLLPMWAIARAVVQLAAVALLLRGILAAPATVIAFLALMLSTASWTSGVDCASCRTAVASRPAASWSEPWSR